MPDTYLYLYPAVSLVNAPMTFLTSMIFFKYVHSCLLVLRVKEMTMQSEEVYLQSFLFHDRPLGKVFLFYHSFFHPTLVFSICSSLSNHLLFISFQ